MDLQDIREIASNEEVYRRGMHYFQEGKVLQIEWNEDGRCIASVQGEKDCYRVVVDVGLHESIGYYSCSCQAFRNWYGACKHIVAVLLQIRRQKSQEEQVARQAEAEAADPQKSAEEQKKRFQKDLQQLIAWSITNDLHDFRDKEAAAAEKLKLSPTIHWGEHGLYFLSLTVGQTRQYIIKNISEFCQQVRTGQAVTYGKQKVIRQRIEDFDLHSQALVKMILNKEQEFSMWNLMEKEDFSPSVPCEIGRNILLTPTMLDDLFEIWNGREICFKDAQENKYLAKADAAETPRVRIQMQSRPEQHEVFLKVEPGKVFYGESYAYLLQPQKFLRLPLQAVEKLDRFLQLVEKNPEGFCLTEDAMKDFDANILRSFSSLLVWEAAEGVREKYGAQPLQSRLYIDQADTGRIVGQLSFGYGTERISAFASDASLPGRNWVEEERVKQKVLQYFPRVDEKRQEAVIEADDEAFYRLLTEGIGELGQMMEIYASDRFRQMKIRKVPEVHVKVRLENDWLDLSFDTEGISLQEWQAVLEAYRLRKKYFRLRNGDFLNLEDEELATVASLFDGFHDGKTNAQEKTIRVPNYRSMFLERLFQEHPEIHCQKNEDFEHLIHQIEQIQKDEFVIPASLEKTLRTYQKIGYQWLMTMKRYGFGGILADDMGLGKTLQIITLLLAEKQQAPEPKHTLIVCPSSLIYNWQAEIQKFAPELTALALIGNSGERQEKIKRVMEYDITITSYDLLRRDVEFYQEILFDYHILDEAQYIKNQSTHNARAVRRIRSRQRFALTGTPIENNAAELWSVFDFLMPGYLYNYTQFRERFEKPIVKEGDAWALHQLNQMTAPFVLRRMKSDVLKELPEKNEMIVPAEMEAEQRKLYRANVMLMRRDFQTQLEQKGFASSKFMLLSILMRLRQLCCHPRLCYENYKGGSGKLELCMEIVKNSVASGHKILLFSQFTSMLSIIAERLKKEKIAYYYLSGSTPKEERAQMVEAFQKDAVPLFLISLKAGGTGLNLTAADIVIHYDPWWNLSAQNQATDRVHRIGQKNSVQVYQFITQDSIEEKILHLQKKKKELADSIIGTGGSFIASMSAEEILSLLDSEN